VHGVWGVNNRVGFIISGWARAGYIGQLNSCMVLLFFIVRAWIQAFLGVFLSFGYWVQWAEISDSIGWELYGYGRLLVLGVSNGDWGVI
jgi:hypothetical protein